MCESLIGGSVGFYFSYIWGFEPYASNELSLNASIVASNSKIKKDYEGTFVLGLAGGGFPLLEFDIPGNIGASGNLFSSVVGDSIIPNFKVFGYSVSVPEVSLGAGLELIGVNAGVLALNYYPDLSTYQQFSTAQDMAQDLRNLWLPHIGSSGADDVLLSHYPE